MLLNAVNDHFRFLLDNRKTILILAILFSLCFLKSAIFAHFGLKMLTDDGQNFTGAFRIIKGDFIYRDYQAFFPPSADYFLAELLKITNFQIVTTRLVYSFIVAFTSPILFLITKRVAGYLVAILIALMFVFVDARLDLLFFISFFVGTIYCVIRFLEDRKITLLLLGGVLISLGGLFRADFAVDTAFFVATLLFIHFLQLKQYRSLFKCLGIFISIPMFILLIEVYLLVHHGLWNFFITDLLVGIRAKQEYHTVLFSLTQFFPGALSLVSIYNSASMWLYLSWIFVTLLSIYDNFREFRESRTFSLSRAILLGAMSYMFVFIVTYLRSQYDLAHFVKGGVFFFLVLADAISNSSLRFIRYLALASLLFFIFIQLSYSGWFILFHNTYVSLTKHGGVWLNGDYTSGTTLPSSKMVFEAISFLQQSSSDEAVFVAPYMSMLYFLSERRNPTIYDNLLSGYLFLPFGENYVIQSLSRNKVNFVVYDRENGPARIGGNKLRDYYPKIDNYLMQNFQVEKQVGSWLLMKR